MPTQTKTFILDTNVLLTDSNALYSFEEHDVVLPLVVLEELDRQKDRQDEAGRNARETVRKLTELTKQHRDIKGGIPLGNTMGNLRVLSIADLPALTSAPTELSKETGDNQIIQFCLAYRLSNPLEQTVLVTRDLMLQIKCTVTGLVWENYRKFSVAGGAQGLYTGCATIAGVDVDGWYRSLSDGTPFFLDQELIEAHQLHVNQFVVMTNGNKSALAKFVGANKPLREIKKHPTGKFVPRNKEQEFAMDLLFDDDIKLVTLVGTAGGGKTLCALAAALEQVEIGGRSQKRKYKNMLVCRPIQPVGKDIGFLPGPQPLTAKILTPTGWTTMGELQVGDQVISRDGKPTKILGVYPKGTKQVYRLTTTDGGVTECCLDHLWYTFTAENKKRGKPGGVKTTEELIQTLMTPNGKYNHYLPKNKPVQFDAKELPIAPYTLGVILGDGYIGDCVSVASSDSDACEVIERVKREVAALGCSVVRSQPSISYTIRGNCVNNKPAKSVKITNTVTGEMRLYSRIGEALKSFSMASGTMNYRCQHSLVVDGLKYEFINDAEKWSNPLKNELHKLGLGGLKASSKFIPREYLYNSSVEDRISLLRGLMDTDGTIKKNGEASFTTTSHKLATGISELVQSLGGRAVLRKRDRRGKETKLGEKVIVTKLISYEFNISLPEEINPFFLSRKADRHRCSYIYQPAIKSIEPVETKEVQCILVENPEHLYITDDYIVTHNTLEEKMQPWIAPIKDNLRFLITEGKSGKYNESILQDYFDQGIIEIEALTFIRGRSIANAFIVIDEGQNLNAHELKTILTRVGENTKIVITGDIEQIDSLYVDSVTNGLTIAVDRFKDEPIAGHITLVKGERSAMATLAAKVL